MMQLHVALRDQTLPRIVSASSYTWEFDRKEYSSLLSPTFPIRYAETFMTVAQLRSTFPGVQWRQRFVDALLKLVPGLNPDAADEASDDEFRRSSQFHAEFAASRYAVEHGYGAYEEARAADDDVTRHWVPATRQANGFEPSRD
jgi:hypothetical protein